MAMEVILQSFAMMLVVCVLAANRHVQAECSSAAAKYRKDIPAPDDHKLPDNRGLDDGGTVKGLDNGRARGLDDEGTVRGLDDGRRVRDQLDDGGKVMMGYSDSWVVEVERGGEDEADRLAHGYGFVNLGQVSDAWADLVRPQVRGLRQTSTCMCMYEG